MTNPTARAMSRAEFLALMAGTAVPAALALSGCSLPAPSDPPSGDGRGIFSPTPAPVEPLAPVRDEVDVPGALEDVPSSYFDPSNEPGTLERFYYDTNTYDDEARDMEKFAIVYLPYGYDPDDEETRYNVLYLMHGASGSESSYFGTPEEPYGDKFLLDSMIAQGDMNPMIVVCVSYYPDNIEQDNDDYDAALTKRFGYELRDLVPQLETRYNTYLESSDDEDIVASRGHRIFGGFSMGAVTTWYRMTDSMDWFEYFFPMSGSLFWSSEMYTERRSAEWTADFLVDSIDDQGYGLDDFFVFTTTGSLDFALGGLDLQVGKLRKHPDFFVFDDDAENATRVAPNAAYRVAAGYSHDSDGRDAYIYNCLPIFSELMG